MAALLAACGGGSSSDSNERAGTYRLDVTKAAFPTEQQLGQTTLMELAVKNVGEETVPTLTVTVNLKGRNGGDSQIPFALREPGSDLAQGDRPVWVLSATYPRLAGSDDPGGATTSSAKTFSFGPLKAGETREAVWKLNAVRQGRYTLEYTVGAGLSDEVKAETAGGTAPGGTFVAEISPDGREVEVNDKGEIVDLKKLPGG